MIMIQNKLSMVIKVMIILEKLRYFATMAGWLSLCAIFFMDECDHDFSPNFSTKIFQSLIVKARGQPEE